eukprot:7568913-Alexandrium_andersonii.AAC.1
MHRRLLRLRQVTPDARRHRDGQRRQRDGTRRRETSQLAAQQGKVPTPTNGLVLLDCNDTVSYTHLRAHETSAHL